MNRRNFFILWVICIIGTLTLLPYTYFHSIIASSESYSSLIIKEMVQSAIFYGVILWISFIFLKKVDLNPFQVKSFLKDVIYPGAGAGISLGLFFVFLNEYVFNYIHDSHPVPIWAKSLASIYGAFNMEVLCRLFLFTLIFFLLIHCFKNHMKYRFYLIWASIIITAIIFGVGHLLISLKIDSMSEENIFRTLMLNSVGGITYGILYSSKGFWTGVLAHLIVGMMVHVVFI